MVEVFRNVLKYSFHYYLGMERTIHHDMTAVKKFVILTDPKRKGQAPPCGPYGRHQVVGRQRE